MLKIVTNSPLFLPTKIEVEGSDMMAVKWEGNNFYSLRYLANDVIEVIEKPMGGWFNIDLENFKVGDIVGRYINPEMLDYNPNKIYPDLTEYELVHIRVGEYEIEAPPKNEEFEKFKKKKS